MSMLGADPNQMQQLSSRFRAEAQQVGELRARISAAVQATAWTGPAADRFRAEWEGTFAPALAQLAASLEENATLVDARLQAITQATH